MDEQPAAASAEEKPPDEKRDAQASRWKKRIAYFAGRQKEMAERWAENRRHVNGEEGDDGEAGLVRVNLIASIVNTIQPNIYAKAPEVSVQPEERVKQEDYGKPAAGTQPGMPPQAGDDTPKAFARTLELVLNRAVRDTKLKTRGKEAVRASLTATTGWVKVIYQRERRTDPLVTNRINDAQDNIQRIEQLLRETKDEGAAVDYKAKMADLQDQISALQSQVEVVVSEGLVVDNIPPERVLILDASINSIDEHDQASAIAHGIYMTVASYKALFEGKDPPKKAKRYQTSGTPDEGPTDSRSGIDPDDELVLVWEVWSKDDLTVYTLCDGAEEYCREPYQPQTLGRRWYPLFPLQLWRVNGVLYARSLVENLVELVDEYNTRRTTAAEHRRKNMPVRLVNKAAGLTDDDITRINQRTVGTDILAVEAAVDQPLQNQLGSLPEIPYNPAMYDTTDILRDIEMVSGAQDASRGGVNKAKTATEAEIMSMGMQSRTGEQLDTIEDWLTDILTYCAELLLLNATPEQIKAKFGDDAIWPVIAKKELFAQATVTIRAGSTAKPNKMRERDQWLQFLPQLQEGIMKAIELLEQGHDQVAKALMDVIDETLRRFDERLSVRDFVPGSDVQDPMAAVRKQVQVLTQQAQQHLDDQKHELDQRAADIEKQATALDLRQVRQDAAEQVAEAKLGYEAKARDLAVREASDKVLDQVRDLIAEFERRLPPPEMVQQVREGADALIGGDRMESAPPQQY